MSLEKPDSKAASNDKSMAENYRIKEIDVEVQRVVEKLPSAKVKTKAGTLCSGGRVIDFFCVPQCEAATLAFRGKYSQLGDINAYRQTFSIDIWEMSLRLLRVFVGYVETNMV